MLEPRQILIVSPFTITRPLALMPAVTCALEAKHRARRPTQHNQAVRSFMLGCIIKVERQVNPAGFPRNWLLTRQNVHAIYQKGRQLQMAGKNKNRYCNFIAMCGFFASVVFR